MKRTISGPLLDACEVGTEWESTDKIGTFNWNRTLCSNIQVFHKIFRMMEFTACLPRTCSSGILCTEIHVKPHGRSMFNVPTQNTIRHESPCRRNRIHEQFYVELSRLQYCIFPKTTAIYWSVLGYDAMNQVLNRKLWFSNVTNLFCLASWLPANQLRWAKSWSVY